MNDNTHNLKYLTSIILDNNSAFGMLQSACNQMYMLFESISKISRRRIFTHVKQSTVLQSGDTLPPQVAGSCIFDYIRTVKFLRGIKKTIDAKLDKTPGQPLRILYAGTGPFGSILTPLVPNYKEHQLKIDTIEYHEESLNFFKTVIKELSLQSFYSNNFLCDASQFTNENKTQYDIIIAECMQAALRSEGQTAITFNLSKFLKDDGAFIPGNIRISALLLDKPELMSIKAYEPPKISREDLLNRLSSKRIELGEIFSLSKNSRDEMNLVGGSSEILQGVVKTIPNEISQNMVIAYSTLIEVTKGIAITGYEPCALTALHYEPEEIHIAPGMKIRFDYNMGRKPKFEPVVLKDDRT